LKSIQNGYFRILLDGGLSVKIFFVLSGIVLSMAFIKNQNFSKLAALVIKRIPRLGIPIFVMAIISHVLMRLGLMYNFRAIEILERNTWLSWCYNFDSSIFKVIGYTFLATFFGSGNPYSTALWTMPHEMLGSIFVVMVLLIATFMNKKKAIMPLIILLAGLIVFSYQRGDRATYSSTFVCFLFGMLFSYYIIKKTKLSPLPPPPHFIVKYYYLG
jgi:peptidoglycan/LPS O-acetylase OafA/YrhL